MQYDWITDVLTDLRAFALTNGLDRLALHLDDTLAVAVDEIARAEAAPQSAAERGARAEARAGAAKGG